MITSLHKKIIYNDDYVYSGNFGMLTLMFSNVLFKVNFVQFGFD